MRTTIVLAALWQLTAGCSTDDSKKPAHDRDASPSSGAARDPDECSDDFDGKACEATPGAAIDVCSEPNWRPYSAYEDWTDVDGCLVRIDVLAERPGPEHCEWQDTRVLITGEPFGARYTKPENTRHYVRDPAGIYRDQSLVDGFDPDASLPDAARDTGFRRGEVELWIDPDDDSAVFLKGRTKVERWPWGTTPGCM
jgi:hypothetical protein